MTALLGDVWNRQIALIVAPAGSGKTTLLAHFARSSAAPVAWYLAEPDDGDEETLIAHLEASCAATFGPSLEGGWAHIQDAVRDLETWGGERGLIVVDDAHSIAETPAEAALERLADYLPPNVRLVVASRRPPAWNLSRLRVSGALLEIVAENLRFRSWEVEQLFRDFYGEPLPAADLAQLARRTEGWAAGLQLFYLATTGKSPAMRSQVLASMATRWRMAGEYLARNVLGDLPDELRQFLVGTSVLGRLNGSLCDELLGRVGSARVLEQLEQRQIFTVALDGGTNYRYHEALLSYLEVILVEEVGEAEAKRRYLSAARLLERDGLEAEALQAYGRAGDWVAIERLLGTGHAELVGEAGRLAERLPAALIANDPWLMVATARRSLADGDFTGAVETYARAEAAFGTAAGKDLARRERTAVQQWLSPKPMPRSEWIDVIRRATIESPVAVTAAAGRLPGPIGRLAEAVGCALTGRRRDAARLLLSCSSGGDTSALLGAVAEGLRVLGLPGPCLATPSELAQCLDQLEQVPLPWLAFMVRRLLARRKDGRAQAVDAGALGPWATAVVSMIEGIDDAAGPGPSPSTPGLLARAGASFDRLGAPVVATWCLAWEAVALARVGAPTAVERCVAAAGRARAGAVPGALALASQAMALADKVSAPAHQSEAAAIASEWCVDLVPFELLGPTEPHPSISSRPVGTSVAPTDRSPRPITLSCFGGFSLSIDGRAIDVTSIKPKARAVLYVVAMGAGRLVHRETIGEAVWPDVETKVSLRNLQVALSAIRRLLQPDGPSRTGAALIREGDAYRLGLPE
ncbi:MAG TPA: AAA family ATPase, partial [Acidimicrobiales bacterium]